MNRLKKCTALILAGTLLSAVMCACDKNNIDKFYDTGSSSEAVSDQEPTVDISKEYSLEVPDYRENVELGEYKNVEYYINEEYYSVTDDMIVNRMCQSLDLQPTDVTDRGAKYGDTVNVSFEGKIDGKDFDGNSVDKYDILLGEGKLAIAFEEQIVGVKSGETKTITYTFPIEYSDKTVAGKTAQFETTINSIKSYKESDITEQLLAEKTSYTKTADYKTAVEKEIKDTVERQRKNDIASIILSKISENTTVKEYDEDRIAELIDAAKSATSKYAQDANMTVEEYVKESYSAESYTDYEESLRPAAEEYMKSVMLISAIAYNENLNVTDEEYQNQIKTYMDDYHISLLDLNTYYTAEDIVYSLLILKVQNFLVDNGKQLDSPPDDEPAAKNGSQTE